MLHLCEQQDDTKIAPELLPARSQLRIIRELLQAKSGLSFIRIRRLFARCFQLSELLRGKNSIGLVQECLPAFLCAACLHALGLPGFNFRLLIRCEIQRCQIEACRFAGVRRTLGATGLVSCEGAGSEQDRSRN